MKRELIFTMMTVAMFATSVNASDGIPPMTKVDDVTIRTIGTKINLQVSIIDPTILNGTKKAPMRAPSVYLYNNCLYFYGHAFDAVQITDLSEGNEGDIVYLQPISSESTSIDLPANITGHYEIQLFSGNYCFHGEIIL